MTPPTLAILFDLDGTVADSRPGIEASCGAALSALGHDPRGLDISGLIGPPLEEILAVILGRYGDDRVDAAVVAYRQHYGAAGILETSLYPGVADAIDALLTLPSTLYIATSKRTVFARRIVEMLGLGERFAGVHGAEPGGIENKAEVIAGVLRDHDLDPGRCLMIGDRRQDVDGARANGVATVGVLWGYGDRAELELAGAMHIAGRPDELIPIARDHASRR